MSEGRHISELFRELTRRRIFRTAGAYAVIAWVAIQVGSIVLPEFGAPAWAMRALIILFIAGFPPAMLAAWMLDVSRSGVTRTEDSAYSRGRGVWPVVVVTGIATLLSTGALWWFWDDYIVQSGQRPARAEIKSQPVIAVAAPRQLAGRSEHEWLGEGIANLIRSELAESQHAIVISQERWEALLSDRRDEEVVSARARDIGVDYLIDGELFDTPRGITLTMNVDDLESGIQIVSPRANGADVEEIIARIPQIAIEIKQALRIPHQERVGLFEADFAIENIDAYETYIAGLAYLIDFDYQSAEQAFKAVLEMAPDYHIARYRLALVYESTGRSELARRTLDDIPVDADLSRRMQLYVDGAKALFIAEQDPKRAIAIYKELVDEYPYEMEAGTHLAHAYWLDFQDAAAIEEFRRLRDIHRYDPTAWMALGERQLEVGDLDEANETLSTYASMEPDDAFARALLGDLAMQQGDIQAAIARHREALELRPGFAVASIGLARALYLQDDLDDARLVWQSVVDDGEAAATYRIDAAFDLARALRGRGLFAESLEPMTAAMPAIEEEGLRHPMALTETGLAFLEIGRPEEARKRIDEAVASDPPRPARYLYARGILELHQEEFAALTDTIVHLRRLGDQGKDDDRSGAMAADYLAGMAALSRHDLATAGPLLHSAVDGPGYRYVLYRGGLSRYYLLLGDLDNAAENAALAVANRDPGDLRLDLELERARAQLLLAEIRLQQGEVDEAANTVRRFLDKWSTAGDNRPEKLRARELLTEASVG